MKKNRKLKKPRKKRKIRKKNSTLKKMLNNTISPQIIEFENPFDSFSSEQRKMIADQIASKCRKNLKESLSKLDKYISEYDPFQILGLLSYFCLTQFGGKNGIIKSSSNINLTQSAIEFLQARILQFKIESIGTKYPNNKILFEIVETLKQIENAFTFSRINSKSFELSVEEKAIASLQEYVRTNTQIVRNWGYQPQVKSITKELYEVFDPRINEHFGFSITEVINLFDSINNSIMENLTKNFLFLKKLYRNKKPLEMLQSYCREKNLPQDEINNLHNKLENRLISKKTLFEQILAYNNQTIINNYFIKISEISLRTGLNPAKTKLIFNQFSLNLDDLLDNNSNYFFLDNPVWQRSIIKRGDQYFCPIPQMLFSFINNSLEYLLNKIDKKLISVRRSEFLERKIFEIVKQHFPSTKTLRGLKWNFHGKNYETDLIAIIDTQLLIIEAKSQKISASALRGAPERIKKHLREIFFNPSLQSSRLEEKINQLKNNYNKNDSLVKNLPVDIRKINKIIRFSVSLDNFASLQTNLKEILDTGWFEEKYSPCPVLSLAEFQTVFDILQNPVQILHYFIRRQELDKEYNIFGDELDYLGTYLDTLFNFGDLPEATLNITNMSESIDFYYESIGIGASVIKPQPKISRLFHDIFCQLIVNQEPGWTELGSILNRFSPDDQLKIEKTILNYEKIVNKSWTYPKHQNIILHIPPNASQFALAFVLYKTGNKERKMYFIKSASILAFEHEHVKQCVVIASNIDEKSKKYNTIVLSSRDE